MVAELKTRVANQPTPYADWTRPLPEGMTEPTGEYREVLEFLIDPNKETFGYQAPQSNRKHLASYIRMHDLDLTGTTDKRTRPAHTLVLRKNDQSYGRWQKQHKQDGKLLKQLNR